MLFRHQPEGIIAISQLTHAWISGQMLRLWGEQLCEPLLLAAEQHDIGWLDWETAPSFNKQTGLPDLFRDVGAAIHAPMWTKGVDRALGAWGAHVAVLVSRHGGVIYRRFTDRHRTSPADSAAAALFLETQAPVEAAWMRAIGLEEEIIRGQSMLLALVDTLSLALCGELKAPLDLQAPGRNGQTIQLRLTERAGHPFDFILSPWPFRIDRVTVEAEGRLLPDERFADEAAMRIWLDAPRRVMFTARLLPT